MKSWKTINLMITKAVKDTVKKLTELQESVSIKRERSRFE